MPLAGLFACALLLLGELGTRAFFKPPYVSVATYAAHYPLAPLYGFDGSQACFRVEGDVSCAPTQNMNIIPHRFPLKKLAGELRIIVIGSSVPWEGSSPREGNSEGNYPSRMLALLERDHPGQKLRLINLSVPGFGTTRQLVRFREALDYEPDLFILHVHETNEVRDEQARAYAKDVHASLSGKLLYLRSVMVLKSYWSSLFALPNTRPTARDVTDGTESPSAKVDHLLTVLKQNEQTMLGLAKARSIPVILVGPSRFDPRTGVRDRPLNAFFSSLADGSVQYLNVVELFAADFEKHHRRLFKDKNHYSAEGTRLVAAALEPLVENALATLSVPVP